MTTTMKKRMFALAAMMMLLVAMAIPAFADGFYPYNYPAYRLNINGATGSNYTGRVLNLMRTTSVGTDQDFIMGARSGFEGHYMMVRANTNYVVNRDSSSGRAIIWPLNTGANDSRLVSGSTNLIQLYKTDEYLTARNPVGDWSQVYFGGSGIIRWQTA